MDKYKSDVRSRFSLKGRGETKSFSLSVFDFDDTLVTSEHHMIHVTNAEGERRSLTKGEFLNYVKTHGEVCDFSDFENINPEHKIEPVWNLFLESQSKSDSATHESEHQHYTIILSARKKIEPVEHFIQNVEKLNPHIAGLGIEAGTNNGIEKSAYIKELVTVMCQTGATLTEIHFYDDRQDNVEEVAGLINHFPTAKINSHFVDAGKITLFSF